MRQNYWGCNCKYSKYNTDIAAARYLSVHVFVTAQIFEILLGWAILLNFLVKIQDNLPI
jgi:hypothetical protein